MATFTLDTLREAVDKKYAPTIIEDGKDRYELPNILRLPKKKRDEVFELIEGLGEDIEGGDDATAFDSQLEQFSKIIVAAEANNNGEKLLKLLNDPAMLIEVGTTWMEASELGEAEL